MAEVTCKTIVGLEQRVSPFGWGLITYLGHTSNDKQKFQVLARLARNDPDGRVVFYHKPWDLSLLHPKTPSVEEKLDLERATHMHGRLDSIVDRINTMDGKQDEVREACVALQAQIRILGDEACRVDKAIVNAKTQRDILSQRCDSLSSRMLKIEKAPGPIGSDHFRLDNVVGDVRALEDKVAGLSQKTHDAGRILNNPPIKTPCRPTPPWWPQRRGY